MESEPQPQTGLLLRSDDGAFCRRLELTGPRILVRRSTEEMSPGGIILAEVSRDHATMGEVVAVGPEVTLVVVGDLVLFGRFSGDPVAPSATLNIAKGLADMTIMQEEDVMGVFRKEVE